MSHTRHAEVRLQQRAIPPFMVELLERFGSEMRCGGADRLFFDKAAVERLRRHMGDRRSLRHIEPWLNLYIIIGDNGRLVTAARRTRRFTRP
ncbi:hypothetical protein J4G48_0015840 [Bradyrhizobium barranii subsp. apii]|uniref:hypothetical protein n=1 Tax=Bradyrhizobium barranii TaxID=2992140 RepID=UPI001AA1862F|nr:hypothetical protein [Bradyrhizobium barranii]UPT99427.1 hypothetical protein J4G48_0015840 [Bradyrhizobium barranii subsp. apii]